MNFPIFIYVCTVRVTQMHVHLQQSAVVGRALLSIPAAVVHFVSPTGQQQLTGAVEGSGVQRFTVDQADQVFPVMFPGKESHLC